MPSLKVAQAANAAFKQASPVSVVIGGTAGIGAAMAIKLATYSNTGQVHIVGRSRKTADDVLAQMKVANPQGRYQFHQCDVSLISNTRDLSSTIRSTLPKINYIVLTPGIMTLQGRTETKEGNDVKLMLHYYSRMSFVSELIPSLQAAADSGEDARVMTVLDATRGDPGKLYWDDLDLRMHYGVPAAANHAITMTDLAFRQLAKLHPNVAFMHAYPGWVKTLVGRANIPWYIEKPVKGLMSLMGVSPSDCADWLFYALTRSETATGVQFIDNHGDLITKKVGSTPEQEEQVWKHTQDVFNKVSSLA